MPSATPTSPSPGPFYRWDPNAGAWIYADPEGGNFGAGSAPAATPPASTLGQGTITTDAGKAFADGATSGTGQVVDASGKPVTTASFDEGQGQKPQEQMQSEADLADAQALRDALYKERTQTPGTAPTVTAPTVGTAKVGTVAPITAAQAQAPNYIATPTVAAAPLINAPIISPTTIAPITKYAASTIAPTQNVTAARINMDPQAQFRQQQQDLATALQRSVNGTAGPTVAELQGQRQSDEAIQQQLALAAMNHGRGANAALRVAGRNIATLQAKAASDAMMARAKEQADSRAQLSDLLGTGRTQDIGLATTGAQLEQQANISNADRAAARAMKQADLEQAAAAGNAAAQNELNERQAALTAQTLTQNAANELETAKLNQGATIDVNKTNAANAIEVGKANQGASVQTSIANAAEANKVAINNQDVQLKAQLAQAGFDEQSMLAMSDADLKTSLANAGFQLTQEQIDAQKQQAADNLALQATSALLNYHTGQQQLDLQRQQLAMQIQQAQRNNDFDLLGKLFTIAGVVVGGAFGGPAGAAVGGTVGGTVGSAINDYDRNATNDPNSNLE